MDNIHTIKIADERLDFSNIVNLEKDLNKIIKTQPQAIIINMENVQYLDSRSVGLFVAINMQCEAKKIKLVVTNLTKDVEYIFKITSVNTVIQLFDNENEAIESLQNS